MREDQIKHMVDRFLGWRLPDNFNPDGGVSFERFGNKGTPHQYTREPSGTNLLDATQAEAMVRHILDGLPADDDSFRRSDMSILAENLNICIAKRDALRAALAVPDVWSQEERDGMAAAFAKADGKHGHYEMLFAVAAWLLRHRQARIADHG